MAKWVKLDQHDLKARLELMRRLYSNPPEDTNNQKSLNGEAVLNDLGIYEKEIKDDKENLQD